MSTTTAKKLKQTQKSKDNDVRALRAAIFNDKGEDKNVTDGIAGAFMKYDRNGCDFLIEFSAKLDGTEGDWAFDLVKSNMESVYDASGYGWDDEDKKRELTEQGARFLLVRDKSGELVGFCHFRFTVQGDVMDKMAGEPCIYVWDVQVEDEYQRKGVGKHLLTLLSLIGTREHMKHICLPVQMFDNRSQNWVESVKGFSPDKSLKRLVGFDSEMEGFEVYSKALGKPKVANVSASATSAKAPPLIPVASSINTTDSSAKASVNLESEVEDGYDIINKEEVVNVSADGVEEELSQEEIIAGLQLMFTEKHGREATPDEVKEWVGTISTLSAADVTGDDKVD